MPSEPVATSAKLALLGMFCVVVGAFMLKPWLGAIVLGLCLCASGFAVYCDEEDENKRGRKS